MTKTERAIIETLSFFSIFLRPLSLEEIWQKLYQKNAGKLQVLLGLKNLQKKGLVLQKNYFYALKNNLQIFENYQKRQELLKSRWQKIGWVVNILKYAPFVQNISIINSLSFDASNEKSDIDIFIICKKGRLWTARAFVIFMLEILGQNKNKWFQAGKFCLGMAVDETNLNLESLKLKIPKGEDIYFDYWLSNMKSVYDNGIYNRFVLENVWLRKFLPNLEFPVKNGKKTKKSMLEKMLSGNFGQKLENWLKRLQIRKIWADPKSKRHGGSVLAESNIMKLHPYDRRLEYFGRWKILTKKYLLK